MEDKQGSSWDLALQKLFEMLHMQEEQLTEAELQAAARERNALPMRVHSPAHVHGCDAFSFISLYPAAQDVTCPESMAMIPNPSWNQIPELPNIHVAQQIPCSLTASGKELQSITLHVRM